MHRLSERIVIVGAGPTGLVAAIELARRGIGVRILDRKSGPAPESRALGINARSLALLEPSGMTARLLENGHKVHHLSLHTRDRLLVRIPLADMGGPHPFILSLPQGRVETLFAQRLGELGVPVEWETELTRLRIEDSRAELTLQSPAGTQTSRAEIVVGADGTYSTVRRAAGIAFEGDAYETEWGLADAHIRTDLDLNGVNAFDLAPVLFAIIPMGGDLVRLVASRPDVLDHVPPHIEIEKLVWRSRFRIAHRQAPTYRHGPVFLAGDAAHVHSPLGARGMNLGMEDAAWLAWRIAEGQTGKYTDDRLPVGREVLTSVDPATRLMSADTPLSRFVRRRLLPLLASIPPLRARAIRRMSGLDAPEPPWL